jgi:predicted nucleic acid-binding protein
MKIFNASPLILLLEEIEEPSLINLFSKLDKDLMVPERVNKEIISKKARDNLEELVSKGVINICDNCSEDCFKLFQKRFPMLDDGELTVISLAYETKRKDCGVIIDEFLGRNVATKLNLNLMGAFGLTLELYKNKFIDLSKLKDICRKIDKSNFRINFKELGYEWVIK